MSTPAASPSLGSICFMTVKRMRLGSSGNTSTRPDSFSLSGWKGTMAVPTGQDVMRIMCSTAALA